MSVIELSDFSQNYGDKKLFENTNFVLNKGEKIGVTGVNGAGKSTLLKIITGHVLLDKGSKYINPRFDVKYLDQHAEIKQSMSIREYLQQAYKWLYDIESELNEVNNLLANESDMKKLEKLLDKSGNLFEHLQNNDFYSIDSNIEKIAAGLGVNVFGLETDVKTLSGGQRAKVILSKLLLENPDVMILDEPTNFLDVSHIEWLIKFISSSDKSFIVVSHDYDFLNKIATHICDVDNNIITKYTGNVEQAFLIKNERAMQLERSFEAQQREIKRLEDYISRNKARASTARMAQSRVKKLEKMEIIEPPSEKIKPTFKFSEKGFVGNLMIKVDNLVVGYNNKPLLNPVSFELNYGDRLAITGFNGVGKSTLLKSIINIIPSISGNADIHRNISYGYYEQENDFKGFNGTPIMYIQNKFTKLNENEARVALSRCGLNSVHVKKQIPQLSGGEQSKIKLCEISLIKTNVLILDEPTNHLDSLAIERLKELMLSYKGAIIFVSHDKGFVAEVANKTYNLEEKTLNN